ncbi:MAG TPA: hypothetical protein VMR99_01705 [Candidatus Paceibacterota bacterium]|nr:hypothetical protein [Candidatus Paceibacterota bacterium]
MAKFEITWEAPEFEYREKDVSWYWFSIIAAALIIAFSVWEKDFLFGFFIVIAEMLFIVWGNRVPQTTRFTVTDTEINIGGYKTYLFKEFESWSADSDGVEWAEVTFYFRSRLHPPLALIVPEEKMTELRANLKTVLKEIEHQPTLIDSIEKFLRF